MVVGLVRHFGDLDVAEEAPAEAFVAAAERLPVPVSFQSDSLNPGNQCGSLSRVTGSRRRYSGGRTAHDQIGAGPRPVNDINTCVASSLRMPVTATVPIRSYGSSNCSPSAALRRSVVISSGRNVPPQPLSPPRWLVLREAMPDMRAPSTRISLAGPE